MNPDEMTDDQLIRLITLSLAVVWTAVPTPGGEETSFGNLFAIADRFADYIDNGTTPEVDHTT